MRTPLVAPRAARTACAQRPTNSSSGIPAWRNTMSTRTAGTPIASAASQVVTSALTSSLNRSLVKSLPIRADSSALSSGEPRANGLPRASLKVSTAAPLLTASSTELRPSSASASKGSDAPMAGNMQSRIDTYTGALPRRTHQVIGMHVAGKTRSRNPTTWPPGVQMKAPARQEARAASGALTRSPWTHPGPGR